MIVKHGRKIRKSYHVSMIDGTWYSNLTAVGDEPVPPETQQKKLQAEIERRRKESPDERRRRISRFKRERKQGDTLMREMAKAFDFKLVGQEVADERNCYVLEATPRAGYQPNSRETKVLLGMRGKMWVDTTDYQWVKVHAEVFRPVAFGLFIARVRPGTEFLLEMAPDPAGLWLPHHFVVHIKADILFWQHDSLDDEYYTNYQPGTQTAETAQISTTR